ncbi:iron-sulfur cluster assembly accessory protein [Buchnera aphidicola (Ceratoglyphina bambusae)]|uniref:HesB/IscA family protein n=1 Tax=Buchnera aphidicola TaxID=9 RepID=UPI0031B8A84C
MKKKTYKNIKITKNAIKQIEILTKKYNSKILEIYIKKTGCAGLKYKMKFIENVKDYTKNKKKIIINKKIQILISKKFLNIFKNTEIDFVSNGLNKNFEFKNYNIKNFCGCGKSFNIN